MIVEHCKSHGITDFVFCLSKSTGKQVVNYLGDGFRFGCTIQYSFSEKPLGTSGELKLAWDNGLIKLPTLIYYGDTLCSTDLTFLMQIHETKDADITITVNDEIRIPVGYVEDEEGKVVRISEKPRLSDFTTPFGRQISGVLPIFYIEREEFYILYCRENYDVVGDILPFMIQNSLHVVAFHDKKPFLDLGNWKNYALAQTWE